MSNAVNYLNFTHTYEWEYCASTKSVIEDIIELNPNQQYKEVFCGGFLKIPIEYYGARFKLSWFRVYGPYNTTKDYDYYILQGYQTEMFLLKNLTILAHYPIGDTYLCKSIV